MREFKALFESQVKVNDARQTEKTQAAAKKLILEGIIQKAALCDDLRKEVAQKDLKLQALMEYKERKDSEEEALRLHGGYALASMPLKRSSQVSSTQEPTNRSDAESSTAIKAVMLQEQNLLLKAKLLQEEAHSHAIELDL